MSIIMHIINILYLFIQSMNLINIIMQIILGKYFNGNIVLQVNLFDII